MVIGDKVIRGDKTLLPMERSMVDSRGGRFGR